MKIRVILPLLSICATVILTACRQSIITRIDSFPRTDTIAMERIETPPVLINPCNMTVADGMLVVYQEKAEALYAFFSLPDCRYLLSAGTKGRGPNELLKPDRRFLAACDGGFKILDAGQTIKHVRLDSCRLRVVAQKNIASGGQPVNNYIELGDRSCFINMEDDKMEFALLDPHADSCRLVSPYPEWCTARDPKLFTYMKNLVAKPSGERFAAFYTYFRKIRFFDRDGVLLREVETTIPEAVPAVDFGKENNYATYASYPYATDNRIYVLCKNGGVHDTDAPYTEMQIWDWDGNPVRRLLLDKPVSLFTVDPANGYIYATNRAEETAIYRCALP